MAFARINFHPSGDVSSVEVGLECVDDPAVLPPLVLNAYTLWSLAGDEPERGAP